MINIGQNYLAGATAGAQRTQQRNTEAKQNALGAFLSDPTNLDAVVQGESGALSQLMKWDHGVGLAAAQGAKTRNDAKANADAQREISRGHLTLGRDRFEWEKQQAGAGDLKTTLPKFEGADELNNAVHMMSLTGEFNHPATGRLDVGRL